MIRENQIRAAVRYSEAFKMEIVRELEQGGINMEQIRRKYGVGAHASIRSWVGKYGNGSVGRVIRVEKPQEKNEREELKRRVRALEKALADANMVIKDESMVLSSIKAGVVIPTTPTGDDTDA